MYQRDNLTQHDQVIAGGVRSPQPAVERRRGVDQDRAAGYAWSERHAVEHRRADRAVPVSEPARQIMLSCGEHVDGERPGPLDQAETAAGLFEADQHEHRVERYRRKGVNSYAMNTAVARGRRDDGDSGRKRPHRPAEGAHVDGRRRRGGRRIIRRDRVHGGFCLAAVGPRPVAATRAEKAGRPSPQYSVPAASACPCRARRMLRDTRGISRRLASSG
jgi:hypothetical protein